MIIQDKPERLEITHPNSFYITSDLHWFHKRICDFTERKKYTNTEQHNQWLVQKLNKSIPITTDIIRPIVLHLGDMFFSCTNEEAVRILSQLNGDWWFVPGNHDSIGKLETVINTVNTLTGSNHRLLDWYYRLNVVEKAKTRDQKDKKRLLILCHFPIESWDSMGRGSWHCFGHCHGSTIDHHTGEKMRSIPNRLDCSIDNAYKTLGKYKPFSWIEIENYMNKSGFKENKERFG